MAKTNRFKPDKLKSCFYMYNNVPKFELFEPNKDPDYELMCKYKKIYNESSEEVFIDVLIFCKLDHLCNFYIN